MKKEIRKELRKLNRLVVSFQNEKVRQLRRLDQQQRKLAIQYKKSAAAIRREDARVNNQHNTIQEKFGKRISILKGRLA